MPQAQKQNGPRSGLWPALLPVLVGTLALVANASHASEGQAADKPLPPGALIRMRFTGPIGDGFWSLAISPDGKSLATGGWGNKVYLWDLATGHSLRHFKDVDSLKVAFSPDGKLLATADFGKRTVDLWETASGKHVRSFPVNQQARALAFSPDGKVLAAGFYDLGVHLWEASTGKEVYQLKGKEVEVGSKIAFSPDGKVLASGGGRKVHLWDVAAGKKLCQFEQEVGRHVHSLAFSPDGRILAVGFYPERLVTLVVATGKRLKTFEGHTEAVTGVAFSPCGKILASGGGYDRTVRLWEATTGVQLHRLQHPAEESRVNTIAFAPDGKTVASGTYQTAAFVWDVADWTHRRPARKTELTPKEQDDLWADFIGTHPRKFLDALTILGQVPDRTVADFQKRLTDAEVRRRIAVHIADLDSERFPVRDKATRELERLGFLAEPALRQALVDKDPSLEVRRRVERLLKSSLEGSVAIRVIALIEAINTPQARELVETMAQGLPAAQLTQEAQAARERLATREAK